MRGGQQPRPGVKVSAPPRLLGGGTGHRAGSELRGEQDTKTWGHVHVPGLSPRGTERRRSLELSLQKAVGADPHGLKLTAGAAMRWQGGVEIDFNGVGWVFPMGCWVEPALQNVVEVPLVALKISGISGHS